MGFCAVSNSVVVLFSFYGVFVILLLDEYLMVDDASLYVQFFTKLDSQEVQNIMKDSN